MASFSFSVGTPTVASASAAAVEVTTPIDLRLDADGDLVFDHDLHWTEGIEAVAQGIRIRLLMFRGEWFLDLDHGVPWLQELLGKRYDEATARTAMREAIVAAPGVDELRSLALDFSSATRELRVDWEVRTTFGVSSDSIEVGV